MTNEDQRIQILFCDDSKSERRAFLRQVASSLEPLAETRTISSPSGLERIAAGSQPVDVLVTDLNFETVGAGPKDGLAILARARKLWPDVIVVLFTAYPQSLLPEEVLEASEHGLTRNTWVPKIQDDPESTWSNLREILTEILQPLHAKQHREQQTRRSLEETIAWLAEHRVRPLFEEAGFPEYPALVGTSPSLFDLREKIRRVAPTPATVLILGPTGSGKEVVARALHTLSKRSGSFVADNCGAIPGELLTSELFGHMKGAFTGAAEERPGLFRAAEGGTLFLDEIADMGLDDQVKFLRALQEREVRPVGSSHTIPFDVRVLAATNRDLDCMVEEGTFRQDLHGRLATDQIRLSPLSERREDIPLLFVHHIALLADDYHRRVENIDEKVLRRLLDHDWPSNVRELIGVATRTLVHLDPDATRIEVDDLELDPESLSGSAKPLGPDGQSLFLRILAGEMRSGLPELARQYGKPTVLQVVELTMLHFGGLPDAGATQQFFGMSYRSWQHWAHYNGLTWRKVREQHHPSGPHRRPSR